MAAKKPGAPATVTLKHLAANLSESHEMSKKQTEAVLGDLVGLVTKQLKKGDRIRVGGLGILQVRKRAARMGRKPATGEPIQIKARRRSRSAPPRNSRKRCDGTPGYGHLFRTVGGRSTAAGLCRRFETARGGEALRAT